MAQGPKLSVTLVRAECCHVERAHTGLTESRIPKAQHRERPIVGSGITVASKADESRRRNRGRNDACTRTQGHRRAPRPHCNSVDRPSQRLGPSGPTWHNTVTTAA